MPFNRPTLTQIIARVKTDIETRLNTGTLLANSILSVLSTAFSGAVHLLHGHIEWASRQLFPDTAEAEYLARWASIFGVSRKAASFAEGNVTFTGTNTTLIPEGTELQRPDGTRYETLADGTITGGTATIAVQAIDAGTAGNVDAGYVLSFITPLAGVNTQATVAAGGLAAGTETEEDPSLRERLLDRIQEPPHGGADFDYIKWSREIAGVTRAFVYPLQYGLGTVGVAILADDDPSGPAAPPQLITDVQDHIDDVRPVTADVTVWTPDMIDLDLTIQLIPDSAQIRAAVLASLEDFLRREAEPGKTILISKIREAVSTAAGENDNIVVSPTVNFTVAANEIAVLGDITWQT